MSTKNDITGDSLTSKPNSEAYRNNYDLIFSKNKKSESDLSTKIEQNKSSFNVNNSNQSPKLK